MAATTSNADLAAFISVFKGKPITEVQPQDSQKLTFCFPTEAESIIYNWTYRPDHEMKVFQNFLDTQRRLWKMIAEHKKRG